MKIRIASLILATGLAVLMVTASFADEAAEVPQMEPEAAESTAVFYLDGEPLEGVTAESVDGTYYVALSSMLPVLDQSSVVEESEGRAAVTAQAQVVVAPEDPEQEATVEVLDTLTMTAGVGECYVVANDRYLYVEDGVKSVGGLVGIPVRTLAQVLNLSIQYDTENGQVHLTRSQTPGYLADGEDFYDDDDLYWLSRIIYCESGNQDLAGKIAVGNVVLNRVRDPKFPDTVHDVIFQKNQFSPAASGSINRDPNAESVLAAKLALDGAEVLDGVLFFNRAGMECYASRNRTYVDTIGSHAFYA